MDSKHMSDEKLTLDRIRELKKMSLQCLGQEYAQSLQPLTALEQQIIFAALIARIHIELRKIAMKSNEQRDQLQNEWELIRKDYTKDLFAKNFSKFQEHWNAIKGFYSRLKQ